MLAKLSNEVTAAVALPLFDIAGMSLRTQSKFELNERELKSDLGLHVVTSKSDCANNIRKLRVAYSFQLSLDFAVVVDQPHNIIRVSGFRQSAKSHLDGAIYWFVRAERITPGFAENRAALADMSRAMLHDKIQFLGELVQLPEAKVLKYLKGNTKALECLKTILAEVGLQLEGRALNWRAPLGDPLDQPKK